ncbi:U4/U6 small nuclear ribonucleoprotein PRP4 [Spathaspora sp. JA1]|nr:U4/U6 small nuclear ribonucleoprotein PRP4 [Spathaspora sp. JA1]
MDLSEIPIINDTKSSTRQSHTRTPRELRTDEEYEADPHTQEVGDANIPMSEDEDSVEEDEEEEEEEDVFYTPGTQELYDARIEILNQSLSRASQRIDTLKQNAKDPDFIKHLKHRRNINSKLATYGLYGSQLIPGNTRAISIVRFSKNSDLIACGSWDGSISILNSQDLTTKTQAVSGSHLEKVGGLDWSFASNENLLISGANEGTINLWNITDTQDKIKPKLTIKDAHSSRITKTLFHPIISKYAISTSFDQTWKLWDLETSKCLLEQEGHSKEVFCGSIHPDGSLFASGGLDGVSHIWDLRSGRSIARLQKHMQGIYSTDWSPNGYHLATASGDCTVKIWDLRKLDRGGDNELFSIPAHKKIVSEVRFFNKRNCGNIVDQEQESTYSTGAFLATSSYDGLVNIWSSDNWIKVKTLEGHTEKVMSCDINGDGSQIISSGWDRSIKIWQSYQI